jgi:streptogramin lyase
MKMILVVSMIIFIGAICRTGIVHAENLDLITEITIDPAFSNPYNIITGPDGNFWLTDWSRNRIGKATPNGVLTQYILPPSNGSPYDLAVGPDGNIWFSDYIGNKIGTIRTDGSMETYPLIEGDNPLGIYYFQE